MKRLGLLRHAKSDWDDMSLRDFDRGLNERGRKGAALMGRHIRAHGGEWDMILASPAERVKRTLAASGMTVPVHYDEAAYMADVDTLATLLSEIADDPASVLLAAHNPGIQDLALRLVRPEDEGALYDELAQKYPTAAFAVLELDIDSWRDITLPCGRLVHFARPRDLDPDLGPEVLR
ncbi:SixA phosphatase family protein [Aurantiacibacter spongiae]|uniref:Histidine phosphatase family protein n=1 Tax=Aurantiacibacter spongiae TaxID=2488860 RepID=A0A3N5D092_9SPHN|nr:histidine phosphatase family protein [Aurantiacibacter spongiae]RPF72409.1 histidine phosphatase family protein [Aurantiacibacter spongiae]